MNDTKAQLKGLFNLDHNIRLYIPSTTEVNQDGTKEQQKTVKTVLTSFSEWFGGATSFEALGAWKSQEIGLVTEKIIIVESYLTKEQADQNIAKVIKLGEKIKKDMAQEAISLEYDNKLYFI